MGDLADMCEFVTDTGTAGLTHVADTDGVLWQRFGSSGSRRSPTSPRAGAWRCRAAAGTRPSCGRPPIPSWPTGSDLAALAAGAVAAFNPCGFALLVTVAARRSRRDPL
jgi:hypothetical protein